MIDLKKLKSALVKTAIYLGLIVGLWIWTTYIAKSSRGALYVAGSQDALPYWQWYLVPIYWLAIAGVSLIFTWEFTLEEKGGDSLYFLIFESTRVNRVCFIALVFFGLGSVIGKSFDPVEQTIGGVSSLLFLLFLFRILIKWTIELVRFVRLKLKI